MSQHRRDKISQPRKILPDQLEITLEELDRLDYVITQGEINLVAHHFQELLQDLIAKGNTP